MKRITSWIGIVVFCAWGTSLAGQDVEQCGPAKPIFFDDSTSALDVIDVTEDIEIAELKISNDILHTWIEDMDITVTSPAGTSLVLFSAGGGSSDNILLTWSDAGVAHGTAAFTCACEMQPLVSGLGDFAGEFSAGEWSLEIIDFVAGDDGTLNEWCLLIDEPAGPLRAFKRGDADNNGTVQPIIDAIEILDYAFNEGPTPDCLDAADADGNNVIEGIVDALVVLNWGYNSGPQPATPGPFLCDVDDDADGDLDCNEQNCGG